MGDNSILNRKNSWRPKSRTPEELGSLYKVSSSGPSRPRAKGENPEVPTDITKFQSNYKGTGSLDPQPMGKLRKILLPVMVNPDASKDDEHADGENHKAEGQKPRP